MRRGHAEPARRFGVDHPMRRRESPWRWPVCCGVAITLLAGFVLWTPRSWIAGFFSPLDLERPGRRETPAPWLVLLPPPEVTVVSAPPAEPDLAAPPPPPRAADWWSRGWRIRVGAARDQDFAPTSEDSAHVLLQALHLDRNLDRLVRPDSVIAVRLLLLQREESLRFDELKPYLSAMARARAYRDIQARAADMYDDFLRQQIIVPD